jgi:hypothetical protein
MVDVIEAYKDFRSPCNATDVVADLLGNVPQEHLAGLQSVVLTNSGALPGTRRRGWSWSRGRKARHTEVAGLYHGASFGEEAWIELFVDQVVRGVPSWALRLPVVRSLLFGMVLFHEVGHHIHTVRRPEHREREDVADDWQRRLARSYLKRRHRLAGLVLRPLARVVQAFARRPRSPDAHR